MFKYISILVCLWCLGMSTLLKRLPGSVTNDSHKCQQNMMKPSENVQRIKSIFNQINSDLTSHYGPPCECGEKLRKIVDLDFSNQSHSCPSGWHHQKLLCHRMWKIIWCMLIFLFSTNSQFSKLCGRINAIQFGTPDAFHEAVASGAGIEGPYRWNIHNT